MDVERIPDQGVTVNRALIVVDVQKDFYSSDGALYVPGGEGVIPVIEQMASSGRYDLIVTTGDWHPADTAHFDKWPRHAVQHTDGAEVSPRLTRYADVHIAKGDSTQDDGYSAFEGVSTDDAHQTLIRILRDRGIDAVDVVGLALDYCVRATALDAAHFGLSVRVPLDATAAVDSATGAEAAADLRAVGVMVDDA
jgi:nicotinamidase/pyrazinamidase